MIKFKPEYECDDISMAHHLRESCYDMVEKLLQANCTLQLDNLRFEDGSQIKFEHLMDKDKFWNCINCSQRLAGDVIMCEQCKIFKPLEMFKNLLHSPMNATEEEIEVL